MNVIKKIIAVFLFLVAGVLSNPAASQAQCPPSVPNDYPLLPWTNGSSTLGDVDVDLGGGCRLVAEWCYRCTGNDLEIYVGAMRLVGTCSHLQTDFANNPQKYMDIAVREIIVNKDPFNSTNSPGCNLDRTILPCPALSPWTYRIFGSNCMTVPYFNAVNGYIETVPCNGPLNGMCEERWRVCWEFIDGKQHLHEEKELVNNGATACPPTYNGHECKGRCNN